MDDGSEEVTVKRKGESREHLVIIIVSKELHNNSGKSFQEQSDFTITQELW